MKKRMILWLALLVLLAPLAVWAQVRGGAGGAGGLGGFNRAGNRFSQTDLIRQRMNVTNALEWTLLEPRVQRVIDDQQALRAITGRGGVGGRFGGRGQGQGATNPSAGLLGEALTSLNTALADPNATVDELKAKGKALRDAREKVQKELTAAQKDLRDLLTVRQEMVLVAMGYLD